MKDIYILGIHDGHVAGAVLLKNGLIVAAINEERLTMVKNHAGIPILSMQKVIDIAGIDPSYITHVAVASKIRIVSDPQIRTKNWLYQAHMASAYMFHSKAYINLMVNLISRLKPRDGIRESLRIIGIDNVPVTFVDHHRAHAASAYFRRPWKDKTLVFTLDGMGDGLSATVSIGEGNTLTRIAQTGYYDSLANNVYSEITEYLGMKRAEHEYKLMGLAPYGNYKETIQVFRSIMRLNPSKPLEFENQTRFYHDQLQKVYAKSFAKKRFDHVAAGAQKFFEEIVCEWVSTAIKETGIHKIACGGGSFLNVKTNSHLRNLPQVTDIFVYPACDDSGIAGGAALLSYLLYCEDKHLKPDVAPLSNLYYGQQFSPDTIVDFLRSKKRFKQARKFDASQIALLLSRGKIIARFDGRDEWGPRALGNRSIMADPRDLAIVGRLNRAIKMRDFWMPFAPSILSDDQSIYVKNSHFAPYMIEAFETTKKGEADIVAAIHPADKTVRPMTVNSWNPGWQKIIQEFKKITGVGAILNTSFNLHGYPLVGTPSQALWSFDNSDLDGLILGDYLITKQR